MVILFECDIFSKIPIIYSQNTMEICNIRSNIVYKMFHLIFLIFIIWPSIAHGLGNLRTFITLRNYEANADNLNIYYPWSSLLRKYEPKVPWISPIRNLRISKSQYIEKNPLKNIKIKENDQQVISESYSKSFSAEDVRIQPVYSDFPINISIVDPWIPIDPKLCPVPLPIEVHKHEEIVASVDYSIRYAIPDTDYTIPPNVCGLCPAAPNDLSPCSCVGNAGSNAGFISISCNATTNWTTIAELKYTLNNADYLTTDVVRFNMSGTNVTGVVDDAVWGNLSMEQIIMNDNQITVIDNHAFNSSRDALYFLSMNNNLLFTFYWEGLSDVPHLGTLRLMGNQMQFISSDAFPAMSALSNLDLSYNQINYLGKNAFINLPKLANLKLNNNNLTELFNNVFTITNHAPSQNFFTLNISSNQIKTLNEDTFSGMKPNRIDLSHNMLDIIKQSIFEPVITAAGFFIELKFEGNPILCNCNLLWAVASIYTYNMDDFLCADRNETLYDLQLDDFNCTMS